jgi:hypothetical protein
MKIIGKYELKPFEVDFFKHHLRFSTDGRIVGNLAETWFAEIINGVRQNERSPFDVLGPDGSKHEIRSAIKNISFASSNEVGQGRQVTEEGFNKKLNSIDDYIVIDTQNIINGYVTFVQVTKDDIPTLGLGKNKKMSSVKFWKLVYGN